MALQSLPSLPSEVLVNVLELCDIDTFVNMRLVNKATNTLIDLFEKQIAEGVASQEEDSDKFGVGDFRPTGVPLLKRIRRYPTSLALAEEIEFRVSRIRYGHSITGDTRQTFLMTIVHGCDLAWRLVDAYATTKQAFDCDRTVRQTVYDQNLYRAITQAQLAVVKSAPAIEVLGLRFLHAICCGDICNLRWFQLGASLCHRQAIDIIEDCQCQNKDHEEAANWASWYALNVVNPSCVLHCLETTKTLVYHMPRSHTLTEAIDAVSDIYHGIDAGTRKYQARSAELVLRAIDRKVSKSKLRLSAMMPNFLAGTHLEITFPRAWKNATFGNTALCLYGGAANVEGSASAAEQ